MIRSLLLLLVVGFVAMGALSIVFSFLLPLLILVAKAALVLLIGYFILRLVRPDLAEECRARVERTS